VKAFLLLIIVRFLFFAKNKLAIFIEKRISRSDLLSAKAMEIKKITTTQISQSVGHQRPASFDDFIGQQQIKKMLKTAIGSAKKRKGNLGHTLFA
jgi:Holliday junction resolvasome RuvABC ATP-dependent DNA helicase subunit